MAITSQLQLESVGTLSSNGLDSDVALTTTTGGGFLVSGFRASSFFPFLSINNDIDSQRFDGDGNQIGTLIDGPTGTDPSVARLSNGNLVTAYTTGTNLSFTIRSSDGTTEILAPTTVNQSGGAVDDGLSNADVTAIRSTSFLFNNGGFVIAGQDSINATDTDIDLRFYNNAGVLQRVVALGSSLQEIGVKVTQLGNGNVAAAWTEVQASGDTVIKFAVYNRDLSAAVTSGGLGSMVVLDNVGTTNRDVAVVATADGFAVFYEERSTGVGLFGGTNSIVMQEVSATGTILGKKTIVSSSGIGRSDFNDIAVTAMDNGMLAVSYVVSGGLVVLGQPTPRDVAVRLVAASHSDTYVSPELLVRGGAEATDGAARPALVRFGANQLAAMYDNPDDGAVQGEHLRVIQAQTGDAADDVFALTAMLDRFNGGDGRDTVNLSTAGDAVDVDLAANLAFGGLATGDSFTSIENLIGTSLNDTLAGDLANNSLDGGAGEDSLLGREGDDTLLGGLGNDTLLGGAGNDALTGEDGADSLSGEDGNDSLGGGAGNDTLLGGAGNDTLNGEDGADSLTGEDGNDQLNGGLGDDTLSGGAGDDALNGEDGNDSLTGGDGNDSMTGGAGNDLMLGEAGNDTIRGAAGDDTINGGLGNDVLHGAAGADVIRGAQGNDTLRGWGGDDRLLGGAGTDRLFGMAGNDRLVGHSGSDVLTGGAGNDTLLGGVGADTLKGNSGNDRLQGGGDADRLEAGRGNDMLLGDRGADTLLGHAGNDTLNGGAGSDRLTGGAGADDFVFGIHAGRDRITDFDLAQDDIDLAGGVRESSLRFTQAGTNLLITIQGKAGFELLIEDFSGSTANIDFI